jgi:predicted O-linked N-acetylglucosamine transferase (SPINDLY family)
LQPGQPDALHLLGLLQLGAGRPDLAVSLIRRAIEGSPGVAAFHTDLGHALRTEGRLEAALASYEEAYALDPDPGVRVNMATLLPVIPQSRDEIACWRGRLERELDAILEDPAFRLDDPLLQVGTTQFHLAYHGLSDRALQEKIARFYLTACPGLAWIAPHCRPDALRQERRRYRIGFISSFFRYHTISKVTRGLIEHLDPAQFEVVMLNLGAEDDWTIRMATSAERSLRLSGSLADIREAIAAEELDLLFYTDIGMHAATFFLAFARLAPVQCVTWGHPETTGIPNVDYYLSCVDLEPPGSQAEYTERLVTMEHLPTYFYRPDPGPAPGNRARFGFDDQARLYICPQLIFKLHPDVDQVLGDILRRDPGGLLVFVEGADGAESHRKTLLEQRFRRHNPDVAGRVRFLPFLSPGDFLDLLSIADVLLDPPWFGGGNTTLEAIAIGTPIVTWPGPFARGRTTYACFKQMGVMDGVVERLDLYAERAVKLATDQVLRESVRARILAANERMYEDMDAVREMERIFTAMIEERGR